MRATTRIEQPAIKHNAVIDKATRSKIGSKHLEESQVVIHCSFKATVHGNRITMWKSTFLVPKESHHSCELIYHENISLYPAWTEVEIGETITFTLIFSGLPRNCTSFDMIEMIPEPGGLEIRDIQRNKADVYYIAIA